MSYPGPVGYPTNLGCDMGNQRAIDQFNFVVDNGGAEPAPSTPFNLQSPASVLPDVSGNASLSLAATVGGTAILGIGGQNSVLSLQAINLFASSAATRTMVINASADGSDVPVALFDYVNDVVELGKPLFGGTVTLNSDTTITGSATVTTGSGGIKLQQLTASSSSIGQQVASQGVLVLGSSAAFPSTLVISDIPYLGAGNFVEIAGGAGLAPLFLSGAQGVGQQCGIHPDISGGGQLLLGSSNGATAQIQITDTTVQYNVAPTINTSLITTSARIPPTGTMVTNQDYAITNPTNPGLYAIVVNVDNTAAGTNNAQVSTIANWNGTIWDYGGCGRSSIFGGGELLIGFGVFPPNAVRAGITVTFTGATANPAVVVKCIPLYGNMGL